MSERIEGVVFDWIGGNCPVQAEGTVDGKPFYFRARGQRWRLGIGGKVVSDPDWGYGEYYGDEQFAAGWMSEEEARGFIAKAVGLYRAGHESCFDIPPEPPVGFTANSRSIL